MAYKYKAVVVDHVFDDLTPCIKALNDLDCDVVVMPKNPTVEMVKETVKDADVVTVTYFEMTADIIACMTKCRVINRTGIGVNNIDVDAATKKGIKVTYVPDYCADEVSDHALALLMTCARGIVPMNTSIKGGKWDLECAKPMFRLRGRTLGLLGFGRIARMLFEKTKALGFNYLIYDPYVDAKTIEDMGGKKVEIKELFEGSDYISLHAPLTPETANVVNAENLALAKDGLIIVNTSRGGLVDEKALYDAVKSGKVKMAGLDVMASEVFDPKNPLVSLPEVVQTPHAAYYSEQSSIELRDKSFDELARALKGEDQRRQFNKI